ncbi:MAG TPA: threonine synthase [Cyclobacteriaceae bacterium]|nr:threonine synthase [Cyclobacteriaceae bacterium]
MMYYSTNNPAYKVNLQEAVIKSLAPDNGLFMPEKIPVLPPAFFSSLDEMTFAEIAFEVAHAFTGNDLPTGRLKKIIEHTITFDAPLVEIEKNIYALELFHGPTLAFKDFGARFMSQVLEYFAEQINREVIILVATSGDTGSAVANGFLGVPGTKVIVLYPSGQVSEMQEKQFTTLGQNITAIEVDGTFDDCQRLVKQAFLDEEVNKKFLLTSANSINLARLIPQSFYYFYAWSRLAKRSGVVFSVPSGNFGNLTAGLLAKKMGLPILQFIAATNINDIVPNYLSNGIFSPKPSKATISNAMDVGNPNNFARILDLFNHDHKAIQNEIWGCSFTDDETRVAMKEVFRESKYILDPHGAVGYLGLKKFLSQNPKSAGVFFETAHPAKFIETVEATLQTKITIPQTLQQFLHGKKISIRSSAEFSSIKYHITKIAQSA